MTAQDHEGRTCVSHARSSGASVRSCYNFIMRGGSYEDERGLRDDGFFDSADIEEI